MEIVLSLLRFSHSWVRWLVLIAAIAAVVYLILALVQRRAWGKPGTTLMAVFSGLVGLQWVIGLVFLVVLGSMTDFGVRHYWEHLVTMTLALVVAHGHYMLRRRPMDDTRRHAVYSGLIVLTFAFIIGGIVVLPDGLQWRFYTGN